MTQSSFLAKHSSDIRNTRIFQGAKKEVFSNILKFENVNT
jgi:hypothetical protein